MIVHNSWWSNRSALNYHQLSCTVWSGPYVFALHDSVVMRNVLRCKQQNFKKVIILMISLFVAFKVPRTTSNPQILFCQKISGNFKSCPLCEWLPECDTYIDQVLKTWVLKSKLIPNQQRMPFCSANQNKLNNFNLPNFSRVTSSSLFSSWR